MMVVFVSDTVETSQNLIEDVSQEALVSAFDEETQAAQEQKKDEVDSPKGSLVEAEKASTCAKDSSIQKPTKETEKVTFKDIVQPSVAIKDPEVKMDTDANKVPENIAREHTSAKIDTAQSVKLTAKDSAVGAAEERQVPIEKGIKRPLEEDKEKPAEDKDMQEGGGKRPRKDDPVTASSPQPKEQKQEQATPQEEEAEPMETDTTRDQEPEKVTKKEQPMEVEEVDKGDDGSRDVEGDEVGEGAVEKKDKDKDDSKEDEDKDKDDGKEDEDKDESKDDDENDKDKDDDDKDKDDSKEDDESSAMSKKRKKKKRSYDRPRGEGGKFMKEKPGT